MALPALSAGLCATAARAATPVQQAPVQTVNQTVKLPAATPRQLTFTVPMVAGDKTLGDVLLRITPPATVLIDTRSLRDSLATLLNADGVAQLDKVLAGKGDVSPASLQSIGINLHFDQSELNLVVDEIPAALRALQRIGDTGADHRGDDLPTIDPAKFSAYLNANLNYDRATNSTNVPPDLFLNGAARYKGVTVEYDGAFTQQFGTNYRFYRRGVRAIIDRPGKDLRFEAGDLQLNTIGLLRTPFIGGIGVEKRSQLFSPYLPVAQLGGRQIFVNNKSTVDILINGQKYQTLELDPGRYDLSSLPIQAGSNNVKLHIRDSGGHEQTIDYNYFFAPIDLAPGEDEYAFAVGMTAHDLFYEPHYSGDPAAIGYYRRALSSTFVAGGAAQISKRTQLGAVTTTVIPQFLPGMLNLEAAISHSHVGTGTAVRASYSVQLGHDVRTASQFSLDVDYESAKYTTLSDPFLNTFDLLTLSGSYSKSLSEKTFLSAGVIYSKRGAGFGTDMTAYADLTHRLSNRIQLTAGVEYGTGHEYTGHYGIRIGIAIALDGETRANVDYRSRLDSFQANISRGADNSRTGSFGYDLGYAQGTGDSTGEAGIEYVANRFDARASVYSEGDSLGNVTDQQRARLQIGTSIAFADGAFGIGRPITDAFAVVHPHPSLDDQKVIAGRSLSDNQPYANSGTFGGAVEGDLSSYSGQDVQFDVDSAQPGFNIGDGTVRVNPPYRAGYNVVVGNSHYISAVGDLLVAPGQPAKLVSGQITALDDPDFKPMPFFTNSAGRFSIIGLAPGKRYVVRIDGSGQQFAVAIPKQGGGLYKLGEISLSSSSAK